MNVAELLVVLLLAVVTLGVVARRLGIPYPVLFVLGGLSLSFVPGLPPIRLAPNLIFLVFLPPLVLAGGWRSSIRDLRGNLRPILLLAVGLVLVSIAPVAVVAHRAIALPWPVAFVLGAVVSPTGDVAVLAVAQRLPIPHQALAIVSAEGLFNDVTSLVAYSFALTATLSGMFSLEAASLGFVAVIVGSVLIGIAVGLLYDRATRHIDDVPLAITLSLLLPFAAYLPADALGASGVLAAVIAGLYGGWREATTRSANLRQAAIAVWEMLIFLLNAFFFILVGLEFPTILQAMGRQSIVTASGYAALISLTLILVRLVWVVLTAYTPSVVHLFLHPRNRLPDWRPVAVVAWAGPRGAISLAAALAVPFAVPSRGLIIFLTFGVILATLVLQGLSLPLLIRWLGLGEEKLADREEARAWVVAAQTALRELENPDIVAGAPPALIEDLRRLYEHQLRHYRLLADGGAQGGERSSAMTPPLPSQQLRRQLTEAERRAVIELREQGTIGEEAFRRVERDPDLEELRLPS